MKYRKRFIIFNLLAGLTTLMFSCESKKTTLEVIKSIKLSFPSASAIEFDQNKLYVFGDDATHLLILDTGDTILDSIHYWPKNVSRISKEEKPDIESAFIRDS